MIVLLNKVPVCSGLPIPALSSNKYHLLSAPVLHAQYCYFDWMIHDRYPRYLQCFAEYSSGRKIRVPDTQAALWLLLALANGIPEAHPICLPFVVDGLIRPLILMEVLNLDPEMSR